MQLLVRADKALDQGDVARARDLARQALRTPSTPYGALGADETNETDRARRILALSFVRDEAAPIDDLLSAERTLSERVVDPKHLFEPTEQADLAEAQARIVPLQEKAFTTHWR